MTLLKITRSNEEHLPTSLIDQAPLTEGPTTNTSLDDAHIIFHYLNLINLHLC